MKISYLGMLVKEPNQDSLFFERREQMISRRQPENIHVVGMRSRHRLVIDQVKLAPIIELPSGTIAVVDGELDDDDIITVSKFNWYG